MELKELIEKRDNLKTEASELIDTDFDKAKEKYEEIKGLDEEIRAAEEKEEMRKAFHVEETEKEERKAPKMRNDIEIETGHQESEEMRAFKRYIEKREIVGDIKTDDGFVVIPEEIQSQAEKLMEQQFNITDYANRKTVSNASGKYPVVRLGQVEGMPTVAELEENPKLAVQPVANVNYEIQTHRGHLRVSKEAIEDAGVDALAELREWLSRIIAATKNKAVIDVLNNGSARGTETVTFRTVAATGVDGLKSVKNKELDGSYVNAQFYMNQDAYDAIDQLKDGNGRYLLQDSIASASGKTLLGRNVVVIPNKILPTPEAGNPPVFYGDMKDAITLFDRSQWMAQWTDYMHFGEGLMAAVRQDARINDEDALIKVDFTAEEPAV